MKGLVDYNVLQDDKSLIPNHLPDTLILFFFFFTNCTYLRCFPIGCSTLLWQVYDKNLYSVLQRTWESISVLQVAREIRTITTSHTRNQYYVLRLMCSTASRQENWEGFVEEMSFFWLHEQGLFTCRYFWKLVEFVHMLVHPFWTGPYSCCTRVARSV